MSKAENAKILREYARALHQPIGSITVDRPHGANAFVYGIPCSGGKNRPKHQAMLERTNMVNPDAMARILETLGWRTGRKITCPECLQAERSPFSVLDKIIDHERAQVPLRARALNGAAKISPNPEWKEPAEIGGNSGNEPAAKPQAQETKPMPTTDNVTPIGAAAQPSKDARAMRRSVLEWLEQGYDTANGRYNAGITDATIAKETGAPETLVKKLREEFYGDAGAPPEYEALLAAIAKCERDLAAGLTACEQEIEAAKEQMLQTAATAAAGAGDFKRDAEAEIGRLQTRLGALADANRWTA